MTQAANLKNAILKTVLGEASDFKARKQEFLAVFDLDSTLFDLTPRMSRILDDFLAQPHYRERFPSECELLKSAKVKPTDWGIGEALARIGLTSKAHTEFCQAVHGHWVTLFFSDRMLHHDEPFPGSVAYVKELQARGAHIMYLTGRDIPRMPHGTEKSLRACGFPVDGPHVQIVLKPRSELDDARFKADVLKMAEARYAKIWLFENEPVNINLVLKESPTIGIVYIDSTHSGREQVPPGLVRITDFLMDR